MFLRIFGFLISGIVSMVIYYEVSNTKFSSDEPNKDKLLVVPKFLGGNNNSTCLISDLILGLNLTKYFLNFNFYNNNSISPSRIRLEKQLQKKIIQA